LKKENSMNEETILASLDTIQQGLQVNGGTLEVLGIDQESQLIRLRLLLAEDACLHCIVDKPMLEGIAGFAINGDAGGAWRVSVDDPRPAGIASGSR
jgi:hypothetical protein